MDKQIHKPSDAEKSRWFSTGFLASGVGSVAADQHTLKDAAVIRCGEARGHEMWVDSEMCRQVMEAGNALGDKGLKARFGHPDMCGDALGTFLGRWKSLKAGPDGIVHGDLFLSSTAAESPKGDLRNYIEQLAAKEPGHFGTSIVFTRDWEAEDAFAVGNGSEYVFGAWGARGFNELGRCKDRSQIPEGMEYYVDDSAFKSPDPLNVSNFRHARCAQLHAADLVDDPAATDGMFSGAGGAALSARTSEWLDTHPEVLKAFSADPEMLNILERYADQVRPFVARFTANHPLTETAEPVTVSTPQLTTAEPDATLKARIAELETLLKAGTDELERAKGEIVSLTASRDSAKQDSEKFYAELMDTKQQLAALLTGQPPVSASAAPETSVNPGDFWGKVRKTAK